MRKDKIGINQTPVGLALNFLLTINCVIRESNSGKGSREAMDAVLRISKGP